jgi:hypothetical protein
MTERITHPDQLLPARLEAGEDYASVTQILLVSDLPVATLKIPHWRNAAIRVRAPSLADMEAIGRETGARQYIVTIRRCCVAPVWTDEQAEGLWGKNPNAVEQIARFCWVLGALDQEWIDATVADLTGAAAAPDPAVAADPAAESDRRRVRRVA